jgi:hypothetical protein
MASRSDAEKEPLDGCRVRSPPRARRGGGGCGCLPPWQWPRRSMSSENRALIAPHHQQAPTKDDVRK